MTDRRPLVNVAGTIREIPSGDTLPSDLIPAGSGALIDGGVPSTSMVGVLIIDFGSVT